MKRKACCIGRDCCYFAYVDMETKAILSLWYDCPQYRDERCKTTDYKKDAPGAIELLMEEDTELLNRINNLKKGLETFSGFAFYDKNGNQITRALEPYEIMTPQRKKYFYAGYVVAPAEYEPIRFVEIEI